VKDAVYFDNELDRRREKVSDEVAEHNVALESATEPRAVKPPSRI
jgi:hypothetical protein